MAEILSQSQIDELLNTINQGEKITIESDDIKGKKIRDYDFRSPKKFTKENIKTINSLHQNFSRLLSTYFSGLLRYYSEITVMSIEEQRFHEYSNALPDGILMGVLDLLPHDEKNVDNALALIDIPPSIGYLFIERLLGGTGEKYELKRDFTEIELAILRTVFNRVSKEYEDSLRNFIDIDVKLRNIETNSKLMQVIMPDDTVVIIILNVKIKDIEEKFAICLPALELEDLINHFTNDDLLYGKKRYNIDDQTIKKNILKGLAKTKLPVSANVATVEIDLHDILSLKVGDVIPLNKSVNENIQIRVNDTPWFEGKIGCKKNKKAVKIEEILK